MELFKCPRCGKYIRKFPCKHCGHDGTRTIHDKFTDGSGEEAQKGSGGTGQR